MNVEEKYQVPPYKATEYTKRAQWIVSKLINDGSSFLKPYTEAKIILEMAQASVETMLKLFEEG